MKPCMHDFSPIFSEQNAYKRFEVLTEKLGGPKHALCFQRRGRMGRRGGGRGRRRGRRMVSYRCMHDGLSVKSNHVAKGS